MPEADHIAVDFETTGLSPWRGARILEVAAVAIRNNSFVGEFHSLVNPGIRIPAAASEIHGIHEEMMENAPDQEFRRQSLRAFADHKALDTMFDTVKQISIGGS